MNKPLIIALDFSSLTEVNEFLDQFPEEKLFVKVGMELYFSEGPRVIEEIKKRGHRIFLDLKLHDIPNTVQKTMKRLAELGVDMVNVHAAGGKRMMAAAIKGLTEGTPEGKERPLLIAVTQLTSMTEEEMQAEQRIMLSLEESVISYASAAKDAGLNGVVCSVHEVPQIHEVIGEGFKTVTPGIRLAGSEAHDQKRIATPDIARKQGTDAIVVGRAITGAISPVEAYEQVLRDWEETGVCK